MSDLRIVAIDSFAYMPSGLAKPQLVVKVTADDGLSGWGEAGFSFREKAVLGAVEHLSSLVVGRDPFDTGAIWQELYRRHYFEGCRVHTAAMSAIDVALHDIKGRALGVPVYALLGGAHRTKISAFPSTRGSDVTSIVEDARALANRGFAGIRMNMSPVTGIEAGVFDARRSITHVAGVLQAVRAAIGRDVVLGVDWHHRLTIPETASFCQQLPRGLLDFLEEPIRAQTPEAYEMLRRLIDVPLALGEEFTSKWEFRPFIERGITQFARVDVANVGGFTEAMKIAGWAEAHYIDVMPHNPLGAVNTAATLHFAAALPNLGLVEARPHQVRDPLSVDGDIFPDQFILDGPFFPLPDRPGLGLEVDEDALARGVERYRLGHQERLIRPDGSLANA